MDIFIHRDGEQTGPFDEDAVKALLSGGRASPQDMAWRKGLPRWLPLSEVLEAQSGGVGDPPRLPNHGDGSGANGSVPKGGPATPKQKAFLKYLGAEFDEDIGREKAALAISDALENPKVQGRIRKWHEEKLRLHPDVFRDEIDLRKANRAGRYLELVQTEGAEVFKDVTKAHVQVLVESLDKRHPSWEGEPRAALWDYLFPSIAEHFPQLVQSAYKGRLKIGGTLRASEPAAGSISGGTRSLIPPPAQPGTLAAMWRGVFLGVIALGAIVGGIHLWQGWQGQSPKPVSVAPIASEPARTETASATSEPAPRPEKTVVETPVAASPVESPAPAAQGAPVFPEPAPPMAPAPAAPTEDKPAVSAPVPEPQAMKEPAPTPAAPTPAAPRTTVTLVQGIGIALPNGQVNLPVGTRLRYLAMEGQNVRVAWNNNVFFVPAMATDVGNDPPATPVAVPPPASGAPAAQPPPQPPAPGKKPSDDL